MRIYDTETFEAFLKRQEIDTTLTHPELNRDILEEAVEALEVMEGVEVSSSVFDAVCEDDLKEALGDHWDLFLKHLEGVV